MRTVPGVSYFTVKYMTRRGKKRVIHYGYFKARIMVKGKVIFLGHFKTAKEASAAYMAAKQQKEIHDG